MQLADSLPVEAVHSELASSGVVGSLCLAVVYTGTTAVYKLATAVYDAERPKAWD